MSDPRFARLKTDPRFRRPKKHQHKVTVDDRFKSLFNDSKKSRKGKSDARVDKYGRKVSSKESDGYLKKHYRPENEDEEEDEPRAPDLARGEVLLESSDEEDENEDVHSDEDEDGEVILGRVASKPIVVAEEDELDRLEVDLNEDDDAYADLDAQAAAYTNEHQGEQQEKTDIKTKRLAVVNLDWDHVKSSHLYKVFSSLVSPSASLVTSSSKDNNSDKANQAKGSGIVRGKILSVRIYPSNFGKERMKKEEVEGPPKEIFKRSRREDTISGSLIEEDSGDEYDEDALRKYQLERLRYYYAIITCDTVEAANHIYTELDGTELERTANVFDLSFVPDDLTFEDDFRDEATPATETTLANYKALDFSTDALRHSKVKLHWDEDDSERNKVTRRTLTRKEIEEGDYRAFIASSESEDDVEQKQKNKSERDKLRNLLLGDGNGDLPPDWEGDPFGDKDEKAEDGDIEITFMPGLSAAKANDEDETTLDKYKRKQKEKRLERKKTTKEESQKKGEKETKEGDEFFDADDDDSEEEWQGVADVDEEHERQQQKLRHASTQEELALLISSDDPSKEPKHFNMKTILKAEKLKGKKAKKEKRKKGVEEDELQEDFQLDVKDERFKALHEDHSFAIDPSNPHFKKTKGMSALLTERAKRQEQSQTQVEKRFTSKQNSNADDQLRGLKSLVESVKRKSSFIESKGSGKRRKM